jgi:hypothetical protein
MLHSHLPIAQNPLKTKEDLRIAFAQLTDPLKPYYSKGFARLHLGHSGASYSADVAGYEGFSRILWGLVPLLAGGGTSELTEIYKQGIINGTNPDHEEYWGAATDYDQRSVEMAAFGFALALIPDTCKEWLNRADLDRLATWLRSINENKLWDCNWLFFRVLVQIGFKKAGLPYDKELIFRTLDEIERFYLSEGWYADGVKGHSDYYVPFALHYYGLLYAKLMEDEDPVRSRLYKDRAAQFAKQFIYWFAEDGAALPYGRSLSYRFSQSAFWATLIFAEVHPFPLGVMKGILLRNLRWWFRKPIFNNDDTLSIGYAYPNLVMAENYNAPGSPYWALKSFLPLALPDDHSFWHEEELPLPAMENQSVQQAPHLVICRRNTTAGAHVLAFNSGHLSTNEHTHTSAKYEKFVYSTFFGFSVPRAEWGLAQGAYDSMLALSEGDNLYRVKRRCEEISVTEEGIYARWMPWKDVEVRTWIIPGSPWHVRVHRVETARDMDAAEGGFALGMEADLNAAASTGMVQQQSEDGLIAQFGNGISGIKLLYGSGSLELIYPNANTNLIHKRTVIPTLRAALQRGTHWIATAVFGEPFDDTSLKLWSKPPKSELRSEHLIITMPGDTKPVFQQRIG